MYTKEDEERDRQENLEAREHYCYKGVKNLQMAICTQAVYDYRKALKKKGKLNKKGRPVKVAGKLPEVIIDECRRFFDTDMFRASSKVRNRSIVENAVRETLDEEVEAG